MNAAKKSTFALAYRHRPRDYHSSLAEGAGDDSNVGGDRVYVLAHRLYMQHATCKVSCLLAIL